MMLCCLTSFPGRISAIGLIALLASCGTLSRSTDSGSSSGGSPSVSIPTDPKEAILQGYPQLNTKSYRLRETTTMSGPGGSNTPSRVMEFVRPDRFHATTEGYESISIGGNHYDKVDGNWLRRSQVRRTPFRLQRKHQSREADSVASEVISACGSG